MAKTSGGLSIEVAGLMETLGAVRGLSADLRSQTNKELRGAARSCALALSSNLVRAAASSGVPVARRVARSIRVKSDRLPVVSITAPGIIWGSEQGPKSSPNRFAVPPNPGGYWIAPTVDRFAGDQAVGLYLRGVYETIHAHGLV